MKEPLDAAIVSVKVVPGSSRDRVAGRLGKHIKIQTSAAPERGKANAAVARLLARFFAVKPAQVVLLSAPSHPIKQFRICGLNQAAVDEKLAKIA